MHKSILKIVYTISLVGMILVLSEAQNSSNSPYSRFGIGDPVGIDFVALQSMGGISAAFSHPYYTNLANPASLGALQATAFEMGFDVTRSRLSAETAQTYWGGSLKYFSLAFPLINPVNRLLDRKSTDFNWGMAFALVPNSRVNHFTAVQETLEDIGQVTREYRGFGGTNNLIWGNGIKFKQWYVGANIGYLFGSIKDEKAVIFDDNLLAFHDYALRDASYRGFTWKLGLQYELDLSKGAGFEDERNAKSITFGFAGNSRWNFRTVSTILDARKSGPYEGLNSPPTGSEVTDTLFYRDEVEDHGKHPGEFSFGALYKKSTRWLVGVNFRTTGWKNYENELSQNQTFENASQFSLGAQYVPDATAFKFYHQRIRYRLGLRLGTDPRVIEGAQIKDFALGVGFGLPIVLSRQLSFINLGVEYNRHGGDIPIKESFLRFNVGVTLNNNLWFLKRKFN